MGRSYVIAREVVREMVRRKDVYLVLALLAVILVYSARMSFGGETGFVRYFKEIGVTLAYLFSLVVAVTFASRQIPQEIETKTLYPVLAHPVTRGQFVLGKFLGVFLVAGASFTLYFGTFVVMMVLKGERSTPALLLLEGYLLHLGCLAFFASLAMLLSLFLSAAANTGISIIIYCGTNWFGATAPGYVFLPHPELFDIKEKIVHTYDVIPAWAILFLVSYAIVYTSLFLAGTCAVFGRRDL